MVKGGDYGGRLRVGKRGGLWVEKRRESYGLEKGESYGW